MSHVLAAVIPFSDQQSQILSMERTQHVFNVYNPAQRVVQCL